MRLEKVSNGERCPFIMMFREGLWERQRHIRQKMVLISNFPFFVVISWKRLYFVPYPIPSNKSTCFLYKTAIGNRSQKVQRRYHFVITVKLMAKLIVETRFWKTFLVGSVICKKWGHSYNSSLASCAFSSAGVAAVAGFSQVWSLTHYK